VGYYGASDLLGQFVYLDGGLLKSANRNPLRTPMRQRITLLFHIRHGLDASRELAPQRVAIGGFGILTIWWFTVYKLTFGTSLGWDTMELAWMRRESLRNRMRR
jgi:hypothetical protein